MKIAVCFSGRTRNFEDTFPYFQKNFFDLNDVDVFVFGSPNNRGYDQNIEQVDKLFKPKKMILNHHEHYDDLEKKYKFKDSLDKMWYNILCADNLRKEYENKNNFKYDYVFRLRFDAFFIKTLDETGINLSNLDDNSVAIPYKWNFSQIHPLAKCDMFSIGTSKSMTKYCNLFNSFDNYLDLVPKKPNGTPHPESVLGVYLDSIGLNVIPIDSPIEFEYPDEIDIGSNELEYRSNYRKFAFD